MNKNLKISAKIGVLCLAFALIATGVFAAIELTQSATGKVKFSVSDALVTLVTTSKQGTDGTPISNVTQKSYTDDSGSKVPNADGTLTAWAYDDGTAIILNAKPLILTLALTNDGTNDVKVQLPTLPTAPTNTTLTVQSQLGAEAAADYTAARDITVAANATVTFTLTLTVTDFQAPVAETSLEFSMKIVGQEATA